MSNGMIERVARAIAKSEVDDDRAYEAFLHEAYAAIEAMREPTVQMTQAACDATFGPVPLSPEAAHSIGYRAMIDAALSEVE